MILFADLVDSERESTKSNGYCWSFKRKFKGLCRLAAQLEISGVADGGRTHDNRNHNPGLYH